MWILKSTYLFSFIKKTREKISPQLVKVRGFYLSNYKKNLCLHLLQVPQFCLLHKRMQRCIRITVIKGSSCL